MDRSPKPRRLQIEDRLILMSFRVEEVDGTPQAVFEDEDPLRRTLLPLLLHPATHFVSDMLLELALVEQGVMESSGFDTPHAEVEFFRDRVVIESVPTLDSDDGDPPRVELSVDEAKFLLLEWEEALQRCRVRQSESAHDQGPDEAGPSITN